MGNTREREQFSTFLVLLNVMRHADITDTIFWADIKTLTSNLCNPSSNSARIKLSPFESLLLRRRRSHHRRKRT